MTLYLYKKGISKPVLTMESVLTYTDDHVVTEDGTVYGPFAGDCELSSLPDCSEALRESWREANPGQEQRLEDLETLVAELLFGGDNT